LKVNKILLPLFVTKNRIDEIGHITDGQDRNEGFDFSVLFCGFYPSDLLLTNNFQYK